MRTTFLTDDRNHPEAVGAGSQYALRRDPASWHLTFEGRQAFFKHELGALYVAYLLLNPAREPVHAVALALKARENSSHPPAPDEAQEQRSMGLDDAAAVRALWRRQRELERVLEDRRAEEPVKAEAVQELEEVCEFLRTSQWPSRQGAERCVEAVALAIKRFHARLAQAADPVLQDFARHLCGHLLLPSGRGGRAGHWVSEIPAGCFTYMPPSGVVWSAECGTRNAECEAGKKAGVRGSTFEVEPSRLRVSLGPAAVGFLSRFLCAGFALALLATGCVGPRPLKGGKAATTRNQAGVIQQTIAQGENASQPAKQDQETIKVRSYTLPAATRIEQCQIWEGERPREPKLPRSTAAIRAREDARPPGSQQPSTLNSEPSTAYVLSAPMPVVEREETRARTELGAAQKDTTRDLAAKLSSLKGIVWVGVGLFVFGLASLVYPPLKLIVASVTTSVALMLGGVALMVLPTMVVGNELLILGVVVLAVGAWFLAHRHGQLNGLVAAATANPEAKPGNSNQGSVISNQSPVAKGTVIGKQ